MANFEPMKRLILGRESLLRGYGLSIQEQPRLPITNLKDHVVRLAIVDRGVRVHGPHPANIINQPPIANEEGLGIGRPLGIRRTLGKQSTFTCGLKTNRCRIGCIHAENILRIFQGRLKTVGVLCRQGQFQHLAAIQGSHQSPLLTGAVFVLHGQHVMTGQQPKGNFGSKMQARLLCCR